MLRDYLLSVTFLALNMKVKKDLQKSENLATLF